MGWLASAACGGRLAFRAPSMYAPANGWRAPSQNSDIRCGYDDALYKSTFTLLYFTLLYSRLLETALFDRAHERFG